MNCVVRNLPLDVDVPVAAFKSAMRGLAGGVSVITVGRGRDITGMTVTSVSSLSVDPPTLIVSVNRSSSSWPLLKRYGAFGVNILGAEQRDIAERFAGKDGVTGAARFDGATWTADVTGTPLLVDALAAIDCEVEETIERHSHAIVIGRVRAIRACPDQDALAYFDGRYAAVESRQNATFDLTQAFPRGLREI